MARQMLPVQQHVFHYQNFHINKSQPLGHGSYGAVYKAKCDQLPCAVKILHPTILDPTDPGAGKIMERFQQECAFLESIRHPNIVQYLGMTRDPESRLPVLLMELLDESLTKMLERSQQSLAYYVQVDICHDIALAVTYLHSKDIIHRDLSSNNVLMIAGRRAKVTDFGMSKLASAAPSMTPLTVCPGTLAYMPPEALREPPRYTKKLDCFSEGVIMIQVCTRLWPEPGPRNKPVPDSRSPTGVMDMPVLETERRKNHIDMINPMHMLLPIAVDCLNYQESERPSSEELCQRLAGLKEAREYRENAQQQQDEIQAKDNLIVQQAQQLQQRVSEIQEKDNQLQQQNRLHQEEIASRERQLQEEIASRERQLRQLNQQLEEQEQVTAEIQQTNHSLQRRLEQLQQQLSQQILKSPHPSPPPQAQFHRVKKVTLSWREGGKAPTATSRGAAVVDGNSAYFLHMHGDICSYDSFSKKWRKLPKCPHEYCGLAVVNGLLTVVGGYMPDLESTNKLLSLQTKWKEVFPPMPTMRSSMTTVTTEGHLIVAGGCRPAVGNLTTVEVMDTKTLVWSAVASLPYPCIRSSGTICGDRFYMLGGENNIRMTKSVLTCSLTELLRSSSSSSLSSIWHRVADVPAYYSTCAAVNGELLAVGGCDKSEEPRDAINKYNQTTNSWDLISSMSTARFDCLVAVLPTNEMMVVGGNDGKRRLNKIEMANF